MTDRFSKEARRVVWVFANVEVFRSGHAYVSTEHLLLALIRERWSVPVQILAGLGVNVSRVHDEVESLLGIEPGTEYGCYERRPQTEGTKAAIGHAVAESERCCRELVRPEHLLVGLLRAEQGAAGIILKHFGVNLRRLRSAIPYEADRQSQIAKWLA
jgi:ATP-dependent Clp protease ATP-binding subunit ClpA